ncbi:MAG: phosphoenolpyruvate--protein phosphotransferase [candidate division WOR-3 bacterium]
MKSSQELKLKGIPVSPGIVISPCKVIKRKKIVINERILRPQEVETELKKFQDGLSRLKKILWELKDETHEENLRKLVDVQLSILADPEVVKGVESIIRDRRRNAESAIKTVFAHIKETLMKQESYYLRERGREIEQLGEDLILVINDSYEKPDLSFEGIIVSESLSLDDALRLVKSTVKGVVTERGGRTEHSAIILRNFKIPAVFGIDRITKLVDDGDQIVMDGGKGMVIVNPMESTYQRYFLIKSDFEKYEQGLSSEKDLPAITTDGKEIVVYANIDIPEEVEELTKLGKYGIGLFRTEMIFQDFAHDEERQVEIYSYMADKVYPHSVTIRAFDIGGDKVYAGYSEDNPFLGLRGIRILLEEQEIFEKQIRAVIRANKRGNIRFMLPMVSMVEEIKEAKKIFIRSKKLLEKEYGSVNQPRFGIMVEIPSAALLMEHLSELVDFVSIGTNDLTQYTLAVDRKNYHVAKIFSHLHPSVLKLIKYTSDACKERNVLVASCGEMSADPYGVVLLVGLGVDEISCPTARIPEIKSLIRRISLHEAEAIAAQAIKKENVKEVKDLIHGYLNKVMPELFQFYE